MIFPSMKFTHLTFLLLFALLSGALVFGIRKQLGPHQNLADNGRLLLETNRAGNEVKGARRLIRPFAVDADFFVAFDSEGKSLVRTSDSGKHWEQISFLGSDDELSRHGRDYAARLFFVDRIHGWLSGLYTWETFDGGSTWRKTDLGAINSIVFPSPEIGWLNRGPELENLVSRDGGITWRSCGTKIPDMYLISAAFVTADEGWVMTESQTEDRSRRYSLFRTNDGGCSWNSIWASRRSSDLAQVTQLKFIDDRHGWFSTRLENRIFRTDDGGRKWHPIQIPSAAREIAAFDFVSPDNGWIFFFSDENDPLYFETRNGGRSWKKFGAEILQQSLLNAISKPVPSDDVRLSVVEYAVRIRSVLERNQ